MKTPLSVFLAALAASLPLSLAAQQAATQPAPAAQAPAARGGPAGGPAAPGGRGGGGGGAPGATIDVPWNDAIPAGTAEHATRALAESSRHGEWVNIKLKDGSTLRAWVTYPERATKAGVVLVIHDIYGLADITRAVGDQLAQDGFISIVPDFLWGKGPGGGGAESLGGRAGVGPYITALTSAEMTERLDAAMAYGKTLPASNGKTGVIGFCWGGTQSFAYIAAQPNLNAGVVYYGQAPGTQVAGDDAAIEKALANVKAPVLGLYAGADSRIGATVPATEVAMKKLGKSYETHTFDGAGHGFMGNQAGSGGANLKAAQQSWPLVIAFYKKNLE